MTVREAVEQIATNTTVGYTTSFTTIAAALSSMLEWLPGTYAEIAALAGAVLSIVLAYTHFKNGRVQRKKLHLEIAVLKEKEYERLQAASKRKKLKLPVRRQEDAA